MSVALATQAEYVTYQSKSGSIKTYLVVGKKTESGKYGSQKGKPIMLLTLRGLWEGAGEFTVPASWTQPTSAPESSPIVQNTGSLSGIVALLKKAHAHLKYPKIRLQTSTGEKLVLSLAGPTSKHPGSVNLTDGGKFGNSVWYGRISQDGHLSPSSKMIPDIQELLADLCVDPAGVAKKHGILTGQCCFCHLPLTDPKSTSVGFGPICAKHYNLPWGEEVAKPLPQTEEGMLTIQANQIQGWKPEGTKLVTGEEISTLGWSYYPQQFTLTNEQTGKSVVFALVDQKHDQEGDLLYTVYQAGPLEFRVYND